MRWTRACAAAALAALAGCNGGSSGSGAAINSGVPALDLFGSSELRVARVEESRLGRDGNGDGDTLDTLAVVLDLADGERHELGLALDAFVVPVAGDVLAVVAVSEVEQGGADLNGDGDASDAVLHVFDARSGETTNTGLAGALATIGVGLVAFGVDEAQQGGTDLNGDGLANQLVFHVYDSRTGQSDNLTRVLTSEIEFAEHEFAFTTSESAAASDLNLDGDQVDEHIFQVYDFTLGGLVTAPVEVQGRLFGWEENWYVLVDEAGQGEDLDGDGDALDGVFHVLHPHLGQRESLGYSSAGSAALEGGESLLLLTIREVDGIDRNGDGDFADLFSVVHDLESGVSFETGLPLTDRPAFLGARLGMNLFELFDGADRNGDGDQDDLLVQLVDPVFGTVDDLGLEASFDLRAAGELLVIPRAEATGQDWNGDGDTLDSVLFVYDPATATLTSTNHAVHDSERACSASAACLLLRVSEADDGRDLNGDADLFDEVFVRYELASGTSTNLRLAATPFQDAHLTADGRGAFLVSEAAQGRDLDGDGDLDDDVLFSLRAP